MNMALAANLQSADPDELTALSDFLVSQFEITLKHSLDEDAQPAAAANVVKAILGWAYMKTRTADQGD
jgi:hypothetical protein